MGGFRIALASRRCSGGSLAMPGTSCAQNAVCRASSAALLQQFHIPVRQIRAIALPLRPIAPAISDRRLIWKTPSTLRRARDTVLLCPSYRSNGAVGARAFRDGSAQRGRVGLLLVRAGSAGTLGILLLLYDELKTGGATCQRGTRLTPRAERGRSGGASSVSTV